MTGLVPVGPSAALVPAATLVPLSPSQVIPAIIAREGDAAAWR